MDGILFLERCAGGHFGQKESLLCRIVHCVQDIWHHRCLWDSMPGLHFLQIVKTAMTPVTNAD